MIQKLHIQNYAIIDVLSIDFSGRMNVITGETGAGKSILMGALSLILGDRADTAVLLEKDKKCYVEGTFTLAGAAVMAFLKDNDLDAEEEIVIRREIAPSGKSRAFINDTPVNLEQLRKLSSQLVDLHRQFDTLELGESDFQREVLDALAGQAVLLDKYQTVYRNWQAAGRELAKLQEQKAQFNKEIDYNKFLFDELNDAGLRTGELEELDQELKLLSNSEGIKTALSKIYYDLKEGEQPMVQQLKTLQHSLQHFSSFHPELPILSERMQSVQIELQDIAGEVERINDHINYDPRKIEEINERLSMGYKLLKKHGVQTTAELLALRDQLADKLRASLNVDESIAAREKEVALLQADAKKQALVLSKNRQAQATPLEEQVNKLLRQVGMPNARLKVQLHATELQAAGMDAIEFLFDANKSNRFEPIRKVASGGELSRLMLCIKSLVAETIDLPTLIFDEIDTGISGEAARQVGVILKNLSRKRQVICITHQPQIAGKADAHYFVFKDAKGKHIKTSVRLLTQDERITAIAQMLGGEKPTAAALENAREMVMN
ncbi:DNA repair protein RecN [Flavitalea sp. BT771]|uniref:DNA repair protein RecN n=1 Tax=Flavitalea sp. BT771 TaxID=3063329 RepID=UPI0026E3A0AD|nr:DNA repair protein RecN [Flavitalea sp. BT771]MDO6435101.1 DNA repair protein RecN [Flavitalea sp. BT771]MDV6224001.1 DNA repair protein RecN [Flavitalea sp. BT771]